MFPSIDLKMLPMKSHFLLYGSGISPVIPYMQTYARQLGFSKVTVGLIYTLLRLFAVIVRPVFGYFGDRFRIRKKILFVMPIVIACAFLGVRFIQPLPKTAVFHLDWNFDGVVSTDDVLEYCPDVSPSNGSCLMDHVLNQPTVDDRMQCELRCSCPQQSHNDPAVWSDLTVDVGFQQLEQFGDCLRFPVLNASSPTSSANQCAGLNGTTRFEYCSGTCDNPNVMHILASDEATERDQEAVPPQLLVLIVCLVFAYGGMSVVDSMGVTMCYALLGKNAHRFGKQRLWGSIGYGVMSVVAGFLVDEMSRGQALKDYSGVFYLAMGMLLCDTMALSRVENNQTPRTANMVSDVFRLFRSPHILVFFVWVATAGMFCSFIWNFLFWHLEELSESTAATAECTSGMENMKTLQGLAMGVQTFGGEIPLFFLSGAVLKRIGHENAMSLVLAAYAVRFLLYSALTNAWWVLAIQPLQGFTFGIYLATMSSYACRVAPPGAEAILQGLGGAVFEGVGLSSGGVIGGYVMDYFGGSMAYRLFGYCALVMCVLHVMVQFVFKRYYPVVERPALVSPDVMENILKDNLAEQQHDTSMRHG